MKNDACFSVFVNTNINCRHKFCLQTHRTCLKCVYNPSGLNGNTSGVFEIPPAVLTLENWMSPTVLRCNIRHSGCFPTTPVSSPPAFAPYHRDLETTFPWTVLLVRWREMNDFLQLQRDTLWVCESECRTSELSSLPNHISGSGKLTGGLLALLMCLNTHWGHTHACT